MSEYERRHKEVMPVIAICYDFDKTLSPTDMQAQGYIQSIEHEIDEFWGKSNSLADDNGMDQNLAYMYMMMQEAAGKVLFTKTKLAEYGAKVKLFPGVRGWFKRIQNYGKKHGVIVEHYIISSGLKEMIEGTCVAKAGAFEKIYANSFYYNDKGVAVWPAQVINYTNKTQFLFRIEKGILDVNDPAVNDYFSLEKMRVPFRNMIYIGDSDTDVPCMKLVTSYGGHSIGVYNEESGDKTKVYKMMRDGRIRYFVPADYRVGRELDALVKAIINRTATNEVLEELHSKCRTEQINADNEGDTESRKRKELIVDLENSPSFANTHSLVRKLRKVSEWSRDEKNRLFEIASNNSQVRYILRDPDVATFYGNLLEGVKDLTPTMQKVKEIVDRVKVPEVLGEVVDF